MAQYILHHRLLRLTTGLLAWVVLVGAAFALPAQAKGPRPKGKDQYKRQVQQLEEFWRAAELSQDADAMDKLLSDDYVGISMTGQVVTKMQALDRMRKRGLVLSKIALDDVKVKLIGTIAIVTSLADVEGTNDGAPMHGTFRYTRVYSRLPSGVWKITNFEATRVGKPPQDGSEPHSSDPRPD